MKTLKGGGKCKLCGSTNANSSTCPLNTKAKKPNPKKHPNANKTPSKQKNKIEDILKSRMMKSSSISKSSSYKPSSTQSSSSIVTYKDKITPSDKKLALDAWKLRDIKKLQQIYKQSNRDLTQYKLYKHDSDWLISELVSVTELNDFIQLIDKSSSRSKSSSKTKRIVKRPTSTLTLPSRDTLTSTLTLPSRKTTSISKSDNIMDALTLPNQDCRGYKKFKTPKCNDQQSCEWVKKQGKTQGHCKNKFDSKKSSSKSSKKQSVKEKKPMADFPPPHPNSVAASMARPKMPDFPPPHPNSVAASMARTDAVVTRKPNKWNMANIKANDGLFYEDVAPSGFYKSLYIISIVPKDPKVPESKWIGYHSHDNEVHIGTIDFADENGMISDDYIANADIMTAVNMKTGKINALEIINAIGGNSEDLENIKYTKKKITHFDDVHPYVEDFINELVEKHDMFGKFQKKKTKKKSPTKGQAKKQSKKRKARRQRRIDEEQSDEDRKNMTKLNQREHDMSVAFQRREAANAEYKKSVAEYDKYDDQSSEEEPQGRETEAQKEKYDKWNLREYEKSAAHQRRAAASEKYKRSVAEYEKYEDN